MSKTIIVYYSLGGNTEYVAEEIAQQIGADTLRLTPVKAYPTSGAKLYFWGGQSAVMGRKPKLEPYAFDPEAYERIIFGFPVWASNITPPLRTFINDNDLQGKRIAAFACQAGNGAEKALQKLKTVLGIEELEAQLVLNDPKSLPKPDTQEKIAAFCSSLQ